MYFKYFFFVCVVQSAIFSFKILFSVFGLEVYVNSLRAYTQAFSRNCCPDEKKARRRRNDKLNRVSNNNNNNLDMFERCVWLWVLPERNGEHKLYSCQSIYKYMYSRCKRCYHFHIHIFSLLFFFLYVYQSMGVFTNPFHWHARTSKTSEKSRAFRRKRIEIGRVALHKTKTMWWHISQNKKRKHTNAMVY